MGNCLGRRIRPIKKIIEGDCFDICMWPEAAIKKIIEGNCLGSRIRPEVAIKKIIEGNCLGSRRRPEVAIKKIIEGELTDPDCTDSLPSTAVPATTKCSEPSSPSCHSPKKSINENKEEKKPRTEPSQNGFSGDQRPACRTVKVIISAKKLSEMLCDEHTTKDTLVSFFLEQLQTEGCSVNGDLKVEKPVARAGWTPSLEAIPEEYSIMW